MKMQRQTILVVKLYMNDETFVSGGTTNESHFLLHSKMKTGIKYSKRNRSCWYILDGDVSNPL
jgi:hypothetical protein